MRKLPRITVITPSFNQAKFIKKTIDSVLVQNYPDVEYLVYDGGSTDGTVDVLRSYGRKIRWISQKDKGQSEAINQGLKKATGEIVCFLNSDDYFTSDCLFTVGNYFKENPKSQWVTGKCKVVNSKNQEIRKLVTIYKNFFLKYFRNRSILQIINYISQPSTFWRKTLVEKIGLFDVTLNYSMDYDYWLKMIDKCPLYFIDKYLSCYRVHDSSKAVTSPRLQFSAEFAIVNRYTNSPLTLFFHWVHMNFALFIYQFILIRKK